MEASPPPDMIWPYAAHKIIHCVSNGRENCFLALLKKALYGLKQAPRAWYDELSTFLLQNHFFKGTIDPTLFIRRFNNDDILGWLSQPRNTSRRLKGSFVIFGEPLIRVSGIRRILVLNSPDFRILIMRDVKTPSKVLSVDLNLLAKSAVTGPQET
ncbi:retrovirus-related pol polyprotein from transposon TNT 1-94 [Tanacetum coccineum]